MMMLLLAAETAAGVVTDSGHDAAAVTLPSKPLTTTVIVPAARHESVTVTIEGDGLKEMPTKRALKKASKHVLSALRKDNASVHVLQGGAGLDTVVSFLPWRDAARARGVSRRWRDAIAANGVVTVSQLPRAPLVPGCPPAFFVPCRADLEGTEAAMEDRLTCRHADRWRCAHCGFVNGEHRILCGFRGCQQPAPSHEGTARLFLGQLRRSQTVPFVRWLVEDVLGADDGFRPPATLRSVENHRNETTGRGKGCAWVYIDEPAAAPGLIRFHHRVFVDVAGPKHEEGVWIVPRGAEALLTMHASHAGHRDAHLPRTSLVVEPPAHVRPPAHGKPRGGGRAPSLDGGSPSHHYLATDTASRRSTPPVEPYSLPPPPAYDATCGSPTAAGAPTHFPASGAYHAPPAVPVGEVAPPRAGQHTPYAARVVPSMGAAPPPYYAPHSAYAY